MFSKVAIGSQNNAFDENDTVGHLADTCYLHPIFRES